MRTKREKLVIEMDVYKFFVIVITILVTLVLPIEVSQYLKNKPKKVETVQASTNTAKVAGASTSIYDDSGKQSVLSNPKSKPFVFLGGFMIATAIITMGYLVVDGKKYQEEAEFNNFDFP